MAQGAERRATGLHLCPLQARAPHNTYPPHHTTPTPPRKSYPTPPRNAARPSLRRQRCQTKPAHCLFPRVSVLIRLRAGVVCWGGRLFPRVRVRIRVRVRVRVTCLAVTAVKLSQSTACGAAVGTMPHHQQVLVVVKEESNRYLQQCVTPSAHWQSSWSAAYRKCATQGHQCCGS